MKFFLSTLAVLVCVGKILAATVADDFAMANKLYAQGKFSDAAAFYEKIIASGPASANLFFNYGNAEFKAGNLGKALAAFRQAELLAPRDSEIRANLNFVRNRVQGAAVRENFWERWFGNLSLNEWTILTVIAFWLTFILLAAKQIRPALGRKLRGALIVLVSVTILLAAISAVQAQSHFTNKTAVVILPESNARTGPFEDAQNAFAVRDGMELRVLDKHDDWVQVADANGKIGWLPAKQVEILPDA